MSEEENTLKRFEEDYNNCVTRYSAWAKDQLGSEQREELRKALHSVRKSLARIEIEMALSESIERAKNPIPVPSNKASDKKGGKPLEVPKLKKRPKKQDDDNGDDTQPDFDDSDSDQLPGFLTGNGDQEGQQDKPKRSRSGGARRNSGGGSNSSGGRRQGGGGRRPKKDGNS